MSVNWGSMRRNSLKPAPWTAWDYATITLIAVIGLGSIVAVADCIWG